MILCMALILLTLTALQVSNFVMMSVLLQYLVQSQSGLS